MSEGEAKSLVARRHERERRVTSAGEAPRVRARRKSTGQRLPHEIPRPALGFGLQIHGAAAAQ
jgi:hypothetical protein